jgi:hypothetical protein
VARALLFGTPVASHHSSSSGITERNHQDHNTSVFPNFLNANSSSGALLEHRSRVRWASASSVSSPMFTTGHSGSEVATIQPMSSSLPFALSGSPAGPGPAFHRSCRDIRHPLNVRNERRAMELLRDTMQQHLRQFPTSLRQDLLDLQNHCRYPLYSNKRHAKIHVRGEKEVLHHFYQWAMIALNVLDAIEAEVNDEEAKWLNSLSKTTPPPNAESLEVQLVGNRHILLDSDMESSTSSSHQSPVLPTHERPNWYRTEVSHLPFDTIIRQLEGDDGAHQEEVHHTIQRYCSDVLGSLRREEFKNVRRRLMHQHQQQNSIGENW